MRLQIPFFVVLLFVGCSRDDETPPPRDSSSSVFNFNDGFETEAPILDFLFPADHSRWTAIQLVHPDTGLNEIALSGLRFSEGQQSLRVFSNGTVGDILSKADIEKGGIMAPRNAVITISANFFLDDGNFSNAFLIDLECCECWDPSVPENQCPGVRLMFNSTGEYLQLERGKIGLPTLTQFQFEFPKEEWVHIEMELSLSDDETGRNSIRQNGVEILNEPGINLPNQAIFDSLFATQGIEFELQEPLHYERFQIGLTANPSPDNLEIWVDNVWLEIQ